ncbi:unnamed protein product [Trifolium pratense]|uniref:Uncharacterized protein n=1 Tax=Trifolium pratense TaxID=57577 RepID=A0ACB0K422_TRIPR|nr:unnamed protein product [Trifolium pratense]
MKNSKNITVSSLDSGGWPSRIPYSGEPPHHLVLHRHIHHHHTYNHSKLSAASIPPRLSLSEACSPISFFRFQKPLWWVQFLKF